MKAYKGVIIEESLADTSLLKQVKILLTKVELVTPEHKTPHLKQWTLHSVEIPREKADEVAIAISRALDMAHGHWYADFKDDVTHYIIFTGKVFRVERKKPEQYTAVVAFGLKRGIPAHQLDFSPHIEAWKRPNT